jgi:hypothetical protein
MFDESKKICIGTRSVYNTHKKIKECTRTQQKSRRRSRKSCKSVNLRSNNSSEGPPRKKHRIASHRHLHSGVLPRNNHKLANMVEKLQICNLLLSIVHELPRLSFSFLVHRRFAYCSGLVRSTQAPKTHFSRVTRRVDKVQQVS